jgi:hypothetical protein
MLLYLVLMADGMEVDEEDEVVGARVVIGEKKRGKGMWLLLENLEVLVS